MGLWGECSSSSQSIAQGMSVAPGDIPSRVSLIFLAQSSSVSGASRRVPLCTSPRRAPPPPAMVKSWAGMRVRTSAEEGAEQRQSRGRGG